MEIKPEEITEIESLDFYIKYDTGNYIDRYHPDDGFVWVLVKMYADGTILYDRGDRYPYPPADGERCYIYGMGLPQTISVDNFIMMYDNTLSMGSMMFKTQSIQEMFKKHQEKLEVYDSLPVLARPNLPVSECSRELCYPDKIKTYKYCRLSTDGTKEVYFVGYDIYNSKSHSRKTKFYDFVCEAVYKASNLGDEEKQ